MLGFILKAEVRERTTPHSPLVSGPGNSVLLPSEATLPTGKLLFRRSVLTHLAKSDVSHCCLEVARAVLPAAGYAPCETRKMNRPEPGILGGAFAVLLPLGSVFRE